MLHSLKALSAEEKTLAHEAYTIKALSVHVMQSKTYMLALCAHDMLALGAFIMAAKMLLPM